MLDLLTATHALFAPCLGQTFEFPTAAGPVSLTLVEARPLGTARPGAVRDPFALTFQGDPTLLFSQQIYRLENATLGGMEIFLVPIAPGQLEAVFN